MPGLTIHRLTDPFALPALLVASLRAAEAALDPLAVVQVVLPAAGWRGWLARTLADRLGVVAGVELIDVAGFRRQLPNVAPGSTLARVLAVHAALPAAAAADPTLADWLARDPDGRWRMALAQRIAQIVAEDAILRPWLAVADDPAAPVWWRALRAGLTEPTVATALDAGRRPAALHWIAGTPPLAHDWALLSGLARELPVTVWRLDPSATDAPHPLLQQLWPEPPTLPASLVAAQQPLPTAVAPNAGALAPLRAALAGGHPLPTLPAGALSVGSASSLYEQLRLAEAWVAERCAADPTRSPAEVLLLSPAWPEAVALVDAVFGAASGPAWPYRVGGRPAVAPARRLLEALLASPTQRWTATDLLGLLRDPALTAGLGLDFGAADRVRPWLTELGAGWGLDSTSRADWQAGADPAHTWHALWPLLADRLGPADPLRQALPRLYAALIEYREASRGARPLSAQATALAGLLTALLPSPRLHPAADAVWRCWQQLAPELAGSAADPPLTQPAFAALLGALLPQLIEPVAAPTPDTAAPEAGLRFAPLKPGAIRPARLIVLFGLDASSFPRRAATGPLEPWRTVLDALHPALAPPEPATADRQLLLESLWMASDATLWLYADRDAGSGQHLPAPTPIEAALALLPGASRTLPRPEPLRRAPSAATGHPAPPHSTPPPTVTLVDLCTCFREPARFQRDRVRRMALPPEPLAEDGPLALTPLAAWQLRSEFLQRLDRGGIEALPSAPDAAQAARLPPGAAGLAAWSTLVAEALTLWQYHQNLLLDGGQPERIAVNLALDHPALQLGGQLTVHAGQLFERVAGQPQARHLVHAWVRALALAAMEVPKADLVLVGLSANGPTHLVIRLPPPQVAQEGLARLLAGYARAWTTPPVFTPAWGLALLDGGEREAHWHWVGTDRAPGESQDPLHRWLWPALEPDSPTVLAELRGWSELLLPLRLRSPWRKHWSGS